MIVMTPEISDLAETAVVDGVGWNLETPQDDGVQRWCDLNPSILRSPSGGCMGERGGGGEGGSPGGGEEARGL
jgi:hypothetical protein